MLAIYIPYLKSQKSPNACKGISRLASAVVNCLGEEKACEVFKQKNETSAYDIIDKIKVIPTSFYKKDGTSTSSKKIRPSYWKEA